MTTNDLCTHRYRNNKTHACTICDHIEGNIEMDRILAQEDQEDPQEPDIHEASKAFDATHGPQPDTSDKQGPIAESGIPDTGQRRQWPTGAVRDASAGKPEITQIYPPAILRLAQRGTDGARKYDDYNWTKGIPLKTYVDSLYRHLSAYQMGDTSEDHLSAVMWNAMGLMYTEDRLADGTFDPEEMNDLFTWSKQKND